jgi:hypothetical protein
MATRNSSDCVALNNMRFIVAPALIAGLRIYCTDVQAVKLDIDNHVDVLLFSYINTARGS